MIIRVTFPDRIVLQAQFSAQEPVSSLYTLIKNHIAHSERTFVLCKFSYCCICFLKHPKTVTTPPKQILSDQRVTLAKAGLAPSSIVHFAWEGGEQQQPPETYLLADLVAQAQEPILPKDVLLSEHGTHVDDLACAQVVRLVRFVFSI